MRFGWLEARDFIRGIRESNFSEDFSVGVEIVWVRILVLSGIG